MWGGIFSTCDCLLVHYRQKDDPLNAVAAGAITGGLLAIRGGIQVAFKQAIIGGVILVVIEGIGTLMQAVMMKQQLAFQAEMQRQEMERMRAMMYRGGDNPYATEYSAEQQKAIAAAQDAGTELKDKAGSNDSTSTFMDKAKSFKF